VPIYLHSEPIDMRKSFDGLFGIIKNDLSRDVRDGGLFMFLNSRRNERRVLGNSDQRSHQCQQIIPCESGTDPEDQDILPNSKQRLMS
ncbi:MAG: IS66 family insertion sequence element accessory protein TnpB, partial [Pirellula sp.]